MVFDFKLMYLNIVVYHTHYKVLQQEGTYLILISMF